MKTKHNEFTIGLTVTIATLIVVLGILWLGKSNFLVKGLHLKMQVENANGLTVGDEVLYRGLVVGTVQSTDVTDHGICIALKIEKPSRLPKDSRFIIKETSLLGEKAVEIYPGTSSQYFSFGDTVQGEIAGSISSLTANSGALRQKIDQILSNVDSLSGRQTIADIHLLIADLHRSVKNLNTLINGDLRNILSNLNQISTQNKEPLNKLIGTLSSKSEDLAKTIHQSKSASAKLDSTLNALRKGKGSLGQLMTNDSLYHNLNRTILSMDSLLQDIKKNPKRYFQIKVL